MIFKTGAYKTKYCVKLFLLMSISCKSVFNLLCINPIDGTLKLSIRSSDIGSFQLSSNFVIYVQMTKRLKKRRKEGRRRLLQLPLPQTVARATKTLNS